MTFVIVNNSLNISHEKPQNPQSVFYVHSFATWQLCVRETCVQPTIDQYNYL